MYENYEIVTACTSDQPVRQTLDRNDRLRAGVATVSDAGAPRAALLALIQVEDAYAFVRMRGANAVIIGAGAEIDRRIGNLLDLHGAHRTNRKLDHRASIHERRIYAACNSERAELYCERVSKLACWLKVHTRMDAPANGRRHLLISVLNGC